MDIRDTLTFDDVLMVPAASGILPKDAETRTQITRGLELNIPIMSSAMDTVTESSMAIAMAQAGGMGVIHRNMDIERQCREARRVKRFEAGMVIDPITVEVGTSLQVVLDLMKTHHISGVPVTESSGKLVGIITHRDVRFANDPSQPVDDLMTHENLVTVREGISADDARKLLHQYRIEKLLVVDDEGSCIGLITVKDIEKSIAHPLASKDSQGRLIAAAAIGAGREGLERAEALCTQGVDVIVLDTAHGHSDRVIQTLSDLCSVTQDTTQVIAGNVATPDAAEALIKAGADAIKIGIGPGSICTTRIVAGVGVPQLSAIMDTAVACRAHGIPAIADGGIKFSGDFAKSLAAGAHGIMLGSLLAGTDESPGDVILYQGRSFKSYRGMGSVGAMARGSADRYFQEEVQDSMKLVPEGIEGRVPYRGPLATILHQLIGGLRAAMGYTGCRTIADLHDRVEFVRISSGGLAESHVHDVQMTEEPSNYRRG